eukprot:2816675-Rhodomonas_salina.6
MVQNWASGGNIVDDGGQCCFLAFTSDGLYYYFPHMNDVQKVTIPAPPLAGPPHRAVGLCCENHSQFSASAWPTPPVQATH